MSNPFAETWYGYADSNYFSGDSTPASSYNLLAKVGTSNTPPDNTIVAVSGIGFQPKLVIPFSANRTGNGTAAGSVFSLGAADSTTQFCTSFFSRDALITATASRTHRSDLCIHGLGTGGAVEYQAAFSSFNADDFSLNWSQYPFSTRVLNHVVLGGDIECKLTLCQTNSTNAAQSFAHGLTGGAPDAVIFISAINAAPPTNTQSSLIYSIGAYDKTAQFSAAIITSSGSSPPLCNRRMAITDVCAYITASGAQRTLAVSSVDSTNVNVTYPVTSSIYNFYFWMIAVRGCKAKVGTFSLNGSSSPTIIDCAGISPKLFLPIAMRSGASQVGITTSDISFVVGASDGTNNVSCGISEQNNASPFTVTERFHSSSSLASYSHTASKTFEAAATFAGQSVVMTPSMAGLSNFDEGAYLILGN